MWYEECVGWCVAKTPQRLSFARESMDCMMELEMYLFCFDI